MYNGGGEHSPNKAHPVMNWSDQSKPSNLSAANDPVATQASRGQLIFSGGVKVTILVMSLVAWVLVSDFEANFKDSDERTVGFFIFSTVSTSVYALFLLVMDLAFKDRMQGFTMSIVDICIGLAVAVLCLVSSSLLADYVQSLKDHASACNIESGTTCNHLVAGAVLGFITTLAIIIKTLMKYKEIWKMYRKRRKSLTASKQQGPL